MQRVGLSPSHLVNSLAGGESGLAGVPCVCMKWSVRSSADSTASTTRPWRCRHRRRAIAAEDECRVAALAALRGDAGADCNVVHEGIRGHGTESGLEHNYQAVSQGLPECALVHSIPCIINAEPHPFHVLTAAHFSYHLLVLCHTSQEHCAFQLWSAHVQARLASCSDRLFTLILSALMLVS